MKKIFSFIMLTMLLFVVGCGSTNSAPARSAPKNTKEEVKVSDNIQGKKVLVAYFSATGTTKGAAEKLAKAANADLFEIIPAQLYTKDDLNWRDKSSRSSKENADKSIRPEIKNKVADMNKYDVIFVGYPIWWGEAPNIIRTFLEGYDFNGKTLVPFCTVASTGFGSSDVALKKLAPKAKWLSGADLTRADAKAFVDKLKF